MRHLRFLKPSSHVLLLYGDCILLCAAGASLALVGHVTASGIRFFALDPRDRTILLAVMIVGGARLITLYKMSARSTYFLLISAIVGILFGLLVSDDVVVASLQASCLRGGSERCLALSRLHEDASRGRRNLHEASRWTCHACSVQHDLHACESALFRKYHCARWESLPRWIRDRCSEIQSYTLLFPALRARCESSVVWVR